MYTYESHSDQTASALFHTVTCLKCVYVAKQCLNYKYDDLAILRAVDFYYFLLVALFS